MPAVGQRLKKSWCDLCDDVDVAVVRYFYPPTKPQYTVHVCRKCAQRTLSEFKKPAKKKYYKPRESK